MFFVECGKFKVCYVGMGDGDWRLEIGWAWWTVAWPLGMTQLFPGMSRSYYGRCIGLPNPSCSFREVWYTNCTGLTESEPRGSNPASRRASAPRYDVGAVRAPTQTRHRMRARPAQGMGLPFTQGGMGQR